MIFKLAFLNLWRHRTRSVLSLLIISSAIAAIMIFRGQAHNILEKLRIYGAENQFGHLQIGSKKLWAPESERIKDQLFEMPEDLKKRITQDLSLQFFSPRLSTQGLLSFSENQFGAKLEGFDPEIENHFFDSAKIIEGSGFTTSMAQEIVIGSGLQKRLKVHSGDTLTVISQTVDGVVNAADLKVSGVFHTAVADVDNQMAFVPLKVVQTLIDTSKVEVWFVKLKNVGDTFTAAAHVKALIANLRPELEVKTWRDLADFYNRVEEFYGVQNSIIQVILITLTILAILNTVGMTVYERTGEIATLRALGLRRYDIILHFILEGIYLACIGSLLGIALGSVAISLLNAAALTVAMPGASENVRIEADLLVSAILIGTGLGFLATLIGTIIPAFRASRISIVEGLRKNI